MKKILPLCFILLLSLTEFNCRSTFANWGSGLMDGVKSNGSIDSIGAQAVRGAIGEMTSGASARKLDSLITALIDTLKHSTDKVVADLIDSVVTLRDSIVGDYLKKY